MCLACAKDSMSLFLRIGIGPKIENFVRDKKVKLRQDFLGY